MSQPHSREPKTVVGAFRLCQVVSTLWRDGKVSRTTAYRREGGQITNYKNKKEEWRRKAGRGTPAQKKMNQTTHKHKKSKGGKLLPRPVGVATGEVVAHTFPFRDLSKRPHCTAEADHRQQFEMFDIRPDVVHQDGVVGEVCAKQLGSPVA